MNAEQIGWLIWWVIVLAAIVIYSLSPYGRDQ